MSDLGDLAVGSDTLSASILPDSSSSNAPSNVSKQLPQSAVDAWNLTLNAAKLAKTPQDNGWKPVSPNPWPSEVASPSNSQHRGLNFALTPSNAPPLAWRSTGPQRLPPGGTYDPETDTWERTQGTASNTLPNAPTSSATPSTAPGASFAERFGATGVSFAYRGPTTPAQTAGGNSASAGSAAKATHPPAAGSGATPNPIDPESLPPGPLNKVDYERVGERNRYLASKYDPNNLYDRFINTFTGAMNDPANVRTPSEQAEHEALSQKIIDTVFPQPTVAEARLDAMEASPLGTAAWLGVRQWGGSVQAQDFVLDVGRSVEGLALSRAGGQVLGIGAGASIW
jgi:hypothetical protein